MGQLQLLNKQAENGIEYIILMLNETVSRIGGPVCRRVERDGCENFVAAYHLMWTVKWRLVFENVIYMLVYTQG